jgi:hypothetical protein
VINAWNDVTLRLCQFHIAQIIYRLKYKKAMLHELYVLFCYQQRGCTQDEWKQNKELFMNSICGLYQKFYSENSSDEEIITLKQYFEVVCFVFYVFYFILCNVIN